MICPGEGRGIRLAGMPVHGGDEMFEDLAKTGATGSPRPASGAAPAAKRAGTTQPHPRVPLPRRAGAGLPPAAAR
jgi:hypothetical protein